MAIFISGRLGRFLHLQMQGFILVGIHQGDALVQFHTNSRRCTAKHRLLAVGEIHSIQKQYVEMDIQIQGAAESLDQRDGTGPGGAAGAARLLDEMGLDGPVDEAQYPTHDLGPARKQEPEPEGGAQHPLCAGINRHGEADESAAQRRRSDPRLPRVMRRLP